MSDPAFQTTNGLPPDQARIFNLQIIVGCLRAILAMTEGSDSRNMNRDKRFSENHILIASACTLTGLWQSLDAQSNPMLPSGPQGAKVTRGNSRKQFCPVLGKLNAETVSTIQLLSKLCHGTYTNRFSHLKKKNRRGASVHLCRKLDVGKRGTSWNSRWRCQMQLWLLRSPWSPCRVKRQGFRCLKHPALK